MKLYVEPEFYVEEYLGGKSPPIEMEEFNHWCMLSTSRIRQMTFRRLDNMESIPEEVKCCCCEVMERLYSVESAKTDNGLILSSYNNDGESGTFHVVDLSEQAVESSITSIIRKWLSGTGLLYCGVYE